MKKTPGPDRLVAAGTLGTSLTLVLLGFANNAAVGLAACAIAGVSWIAVLATVNVSVQVSLPKWVRGRGLAVFVTIFFGAMTAGSALWGQLASILGLPAAHLIAAAGAMAGIVVTWRCKLQGSASLDLAPSMHWPASIFKVLRLSQEAIVSAATSLDPLFPKPCFPIGGQHNSRRGPLAVRQKPPFVRNPSPA
jgi:MFS family permease